MKQWIAILVFGGLLLQSSLVASSDSHQINVTDEIGCLTEVIYFEARSQSTAGQIAVANVVMNRTFSNRWPTTVCGVVNQRFQFSYTHKVKDKSFYDRTAYRRAMRLAERVYFDDILDVTDGATMYHHTRITPEWNWSRLEKVVLIDSHVFYKHN